MKNNTIAILIITVLILGFAGSFLFMNNMHNGMHGDTDHMKGMEGMHDHKDTNDDIGPEETLNFITRKNEIISSNLMKGNYKCCLEKPCTYCIEKTPKHGEGTTCDCLSDVVNGKHPCGECIGEILEGHGNKFLAPYFAKAIADEIGHETTLKQIISEKYGISVEEQL